MTTQVYIPYSPKAGLPSPTLCKMSDPKERFYRHFQTEITAIQDQIEDLATLSSVGGERQDCIDTVLAGISRLSNEVADAKDFIPAYDQRTYGQAIKALTEKLNEATGKFATKSRFQFKPRASKPAHGHDQQQPPDPRQITLQNPLNRANGTNPATASGPIPTNDGDRDSVGPLPEVHRASKTRDYNGEMTRPTAFGEADSVRKPSFSTAKNISIYEQTGLHIMLPSSASHATSSGALQSLDRCVVDMTAPTSSSTGAPFAGLALKDIRRSLLLCGTVSGPVHVTGVRDSVIVVSARQVRMHECANVEVYLHCSSHPIIEDCSDMRFAPIPNCYASKPGELSADNQWDQVDDFKWLKSEPSPNWVALPEDKRVAEATWQTVLSGSPSPSIDEILRRAGVL